MNATLTQTALFGVDADQRSSFDTRQAFEAAWKQHKATCPDANIESFRTAFLAALYHSTNYFSRSL